MTTTQQLPACPDVTEQATAVTRYTAPATIPLMGAADPGSAVALMGAAAPGFAVALMGPADAGETALMRPAW